MLSTLIALALVNVGALHLTIEQVLATGIIVWIWNRLGLSPKATLIGNLLAIILLIILAFLV